MFTCCVWGDFGVLVKKTSNILSSKNHKRIEIKRVICLSLFCAATIINTIDNDWDNIFNHIIFNLQRLLNAQHAMYVVDVLMHSMSPMHVLSVLLTSI